MARSSSKDRDGPIMSKKPRMLMLATRRQSDVPWKAATPPSMPLDSTSNGTMKHSGPSTSWARCTSPASRIYRYRALIELVLKETGRSRLLIPLPFFVWEAMARLLMLLPKPPLTTDAVTLMKGDNVVGEGVLTFADLGLEPTAMEVVLPVMLSSRQ